jgi:hypothetical protein
MVVGSSSGFSAESTCEIEDETSHQNKANCPAAEHRAANVKSPSNEQKRQKQYERRYFHGIIY